MLCMETVKLETDSSPILIALKISDANFMNARYTGQWEEGVKQG